MLPQEYCTTKQLGKSIEINKKNTKKRKVIDYGKKTTTNSERFS